MKKDRHPLYFYLVLIFLIFSTNVKAQNKSTAVPIIASNLTYQVPLLGFGHFLNKDWKTGSIFGLVEGATYLYGQKFTRFSKDTLLYPCKSTSKIVYNKYCKGLSPTQFAKKKLISYSYKHYVYLRDIDFFLTYRNYRKDEIHSIPLTNQSFWNLAVSPYKWKYLREPELYVPAILASMSSILGYDKKRSILNAKSINWFGKEITPLKATLGHSLIDWSFLTLVSIAEEMFFRGMIQTELSEQVNPNFGLIVSSILFGLYHVPSYGWKNALLYPTPSGFYLGWQYKKSGYDLGKVISIHFYIDFLPSLIEFFKNPLFDRGVYRVSYI